MKNNEKIYFSPPEVHAIALAIGGLIEDMNAMKTEKYMHVPWTPEARKYQKEIISAARSAAHKLEKFTGISCDLPPYREGDEDEFLTKPS